MKTFKQHVTESVRYADRNHLMQAVTEYQHAGEILNPVYQDLNGQARRLFEKDSRSAKDMVFHLIAGQNVEDEELTDLYYAWPWDSFASLGTFEKAIVKIEKKNWDTSRKADIKMVVGAARHVTNTWIPVRDALKDLKTKVVKVTQKRAEAKDVAQKAIDKKFTDSSSLIKIFEQHLEEYKSEAKKRAEAFILDKIKVLKAAEMDLEKVAPSPSSSNSREAYQVANAKRQLYNMITKSKERYSYPRRGEPDIRVVDKNGVKRYVDQAVQGAEDSYRAFMQKMIEKIGDPVVEAKMTGNIWTSAVLTVKTTKGETQVWNTKMILNFSKYQKMFNQFPSRRKS
jgi:hypothetical protein